GCIEGFYARGLLRSGFGGAAGAVERLQLGRSDRPAEVEALTELAAVREEELSLLLGLDSLGQRVEPQVPRKLDDRGDEDGRVRIVRQVLDERPVDLQSAHAHLVQTGERRVPAPEVEPD